MSDTPENDKCLQFADYVLEGCILATSSYPPVLWSSSPKLAKKRANNGPGSFHAYFNVQFPACHPNIFRFLDIIMEIKTETYVKMRSFDGTALRKSERERLQFTVDKFSDYSSGEISRLGYIRCLGYKFGAVTDI